MQVITIASLAGGQGKTTVALLLAIALSEKGYRCCWVDCDPQASLTANSRVTFAEDDPTLLEVLTGEVAVDGALYRTQANVDIIPADRQLNSANVFLAGKGAPALYLRNKLKAVVKSYDYILVDSPPQSSLLTIAAIGSANHIIIPCEVGIKGITLSSTNSIIGSLPDTLAICEEMDEEGVLGGQVLAAVPFRDKWVGRTQVLSCKQASDRISALTKVKELRCTKAILDSEQYRKAVEGLCTLGSLGKPDLGLPIDELVAMLEGLG